MSLLSKLVPGVKRAAALALGLLPGLVLDQLRLKLAWESVRELRPSPEFFVELVLVLESALQLVAVLEPTLAVTPAHAGAGSGSELGQKLTLVCAPAHDLALELELVRLRT